MCVTGATPWCALADTYFPTTARASAVMNTEGRPGLMQGAHERGGIPRGWLGITYIKHDSDPHADRCEQNESGCHMPPGRLQANSAVRIANVNVESEGEESAAQAQPQRQSSGFTRHRARSARRKWQTGGRMRPCPADRAHFSSACCRALCISPRSSEGISDFCFCSIELQMRSDSRNS